MSFYDKLEFQSDGRLKRGQLSKLTDDEKHQYYLDYTAKYYLLRRRKNIVKNPDKPMRKNNRLKISNISIINRILEPVDHTEKTVIEHF